jgi:hypothetical protein
MTTTNMNELSISKENFLWRVIFSSKLLRCHVTSLIFRLRLSTDRGNLETSGAASGLRTIFVIR